MSARLDLFVLIAGAALAAAAAPAADELTVAVLGHPVERGDVIGAADLSDARLPAARARGALSAAEVDGMAALRRLPAGGIVRAGDIGTPQLVRRGEAVTIRWQQGALTITSSGRALGGGAAGDPVRVVATPTSRTLDAVIEGAGAVRIAGN